MQRCCYHAAKLCFTSNNRAVAVQAGWQWVGICAGLADGGCFIDCLLLVVAGRLPRIAWWVADVKHRLVATMLGC